MKHPAGDTQCVLVVDDHELSRKFTVAALRESVPTVKQAGSGRQAIEAAKRFLPQLIIMDLNLPDMDGNEAIAAIRRNWSRSAPLPEFVVLSAESSERSRRRITPTGIRKVLLKPVEAAQLRRLLAAPSAPGKEDAGTSATAAVRRLAERELGRGLRELDALISGVDWPGAKELSHRLIATAAMAGRDRLERSLRTLHAVCSPQAEMEELARAYFAVLANRGSLEKPAHRRSR